MINDYVIILEPYVYVKSLTCISLRQHLCKILICHVVLVAAICTLMTGMCFLVTQQMVKFIEMNKMYESSRVVVEFDIGFYMVTAAGALSILAVASTLMCVSRSTTNAARGWSHDPVMEPTDGQLLDADACRLNRAASACNAQTARAPPPYRP